MSYPGSGRADFYEFGGWNAVCYECGRKRKASMMKRHWQGYWVCPEHWEARQPQDFVRSIPDVITPPWAQPMPADVFVPICTLTGREGVAGLAVAGCSVAGVNNFIPPFDWPFCLPEGHIGRADIGSADCAIVIA